MVVLREIVQTALKTVASRGGQEVAASISKGVSASGSRSLLDGVSIKVGGQSAGAFSPAKALLPSGSRALVEGASNKVSSLGGHEVAGGISLAKAVRPSGSRPLLEGASNRGSSPATSGAGLGLASIFGEGIAFARRGGVLGKRHQTSFSCRTSFQYLCRRGMIKSPVTTLSVEERLAAERATLDLCIQGLIESWKNVDNVSNRVPFKGPVLQFVANGVALFCANCLLGLAFMGTFKSMTGIGAAGAQPAGANGAQPAGANGAQPAPPVIIVMGMTYQGFYAPVSSGIKMEDMPFYLKVGKLEPSGTDEEEGVPSGTNKEESDCGSGPK